MTSEKTAVLVVTGVIAVLAALTLVRSSPESPAAMRGSPHGEQWQARDQRFVRIRDPAPPADPASPQVRPQVKPRPQPRPYLVRPGDTLESIARNMLGRRQAWRRIFTANRDLLSSPDRIRAGMHLRIPSW